MKKIAHVRDLEAITDLPTQVLKVIEEAVTILDTEYGEDRDVDSGYGGYILVIGSRDDLRQLKELHIDLETAIFEYVDEIPCDDGQVYVSALILQGSEFGIVLVMPLEVFNSLRRE